MSKQDSLNVFYVLQQSIYNKEGKWLAADSNINMFLDLANSIYVLNPNVHFYTLIAPIKDFADWNAYPELPNVTWIEFKFPVNAFLNRYQLDLEKFLAAWKCVEERAGAPIDVLWNNITELTGNMKQVLWQNEIFPKIATCCYWLDCPQIGEEKVPWDVTYMFRQFEGFLLSDIAAFTCPSTKEAFFENGAEIFNKYLMKHIDDKSTIWDFGYLQKNICAKDEYKWDLPVVLFPNRLSGINYTNHKVFIEAVNKLWDERQDFQVFFTNPSQKVTTEWLKENVKPFREILHTPLSREEYFKLLKSTAVFCSLYEIERYGGCAHREALASGAIPVTTKRFEYERIQGPEYPFYTQEWCINDENFLKKQISRALDAWYNGYKVPEEIINRCKQSSFEEASKVVLQDLGRICEKELL